MLRPKADQIPHGQRPHRRHRELASPLSCDSLGDLTEIPAPTQGPRNPKQRTER
jgi:hypothetical protein